MELKHSWAGVTPVVGTAELALELMPAPQRANTHLPVAFPIRRALPSDVPAILTLLDRYARLGLVLPRAPEVVYRQFREYLVATEDGVVVGCAGLRIYHQSLAEVVGVAVAEERQGQGIGRRVVSAVIDEARLLAIPRIFALTLQETFFRQLGFRTVPMGEVPEKIEADRAEGIDRARCMKTTMIRDLDP